MNILIACEESQAVCKAFRALGHEAYSCDILPCSGGHPEWHIQGDVLTVIDTKTGSYYLLANGDVVYISIWDLMIAHPPCTYLSHAGAVHLYPKGVLNSDRKAKGDEAKEFFVKLLNAPIPKICIENPVPSKIFGLPAYNQTIQPCEYGHPYTQKTCFWLKELPKLMPTNTIKPSQSTKVPGNWFNKGGKDRQKNRSKTFPGIARAMAQQWGGQQ